MHARPASWNFLRVLDAPRTKVQSNAAALPMYDRETNGQRGKGAEGQRGDAARSIWLYITRLGFFHHHASARPFTRNGVILSSLVSGMRPRAALRWRLSSGKGRALASRLKRGPTVKFITRHVSPERLSGKHDCPAGRNSHTEDDDDDDDDDERRRGGAGGGRRKSPTPRDPSRKLAKEDGEDGGGGRGRERRGKFSFAGCH